MGGPSPMGIRARLGLLKINRFRASCVRLHVEIHFLTFGQLRHTCLLDRRDVNEHVFRAIFGGNEAEASGYIKKLHGTCRH